MEAESQLESEGETKLDSVRRHWVNDSGLQHKKYSPTIFESPTRTPADGYYKGLALSLSLSLLVFLAHCVCIAMWNTEACKELPGALPRIVLSSWHTTSD